ncbi:MAG TPA: hypothetical protein PLC59_00345 [Bacteroidales bacterium]|jgi:hypothetical protein|nr:hypothetical protein [Bacteroidales bacterium]
MYVKAKNVNYGYAVTTYGDYVVVSNPNLLRWDRATASIEERTGSVDVFLYNKSKDEHDYVGTIYQLWREFDVRLTTEKNNPISASTPISAENSPLVFYPEYNICIDKDLYTASLENGFGVSLDMYEKLLVVGTPYLTEVCQTSASFITASWAMTEVYDLARTEWTAKSSSAAAFIIDDPDLHSSLVETGSFGMAVSINKDWIAIGAPYYSASNGAVYLYKNESTNNNYSWSLFQKITLTDGVDKSQFGWSLKLNKYEGPHSYSLVVGCGNPMSSKAYLFEYVNNTWIQTYVFRPDLSVYPMTFNSKYIPQPDNITMNVYNGFGYSVGIYGDTVIVGEPYDRMFYEYNGSTLYQQGSAYIFERCPPELEGWEQVLKTYGTPTTLYNNRMGWSVDIFSGSAIVGIPKLDVTSKDSCYIEGTLNQLRYCSSELENILCGQAMLLQKNTGSGIWEITNVYQKKKKYLSPYREYGFDVEIADFSMVVGAPMYLCDENRLINIEVTHSSNTDLDDITGKAYIYNFHNLRDTFHVGNVFYRNGKFIIMTSGSVFDGLFYSPINTYTYEYDLRFKSQHTIHEKQIICTVEPGEFNVSQNPTAIVNSYSIFDINKNGKFDFQDADVILSYMQYKNTAILGVPVSTDWSSSIVKSDDEISLLNYYKSITNNTVTAQLISESLLRWETIDTEMQFILDLNEDSRIDYRDMNIIWKYFSNRLNQENYSTYITPACHRRFFNDIMDYLNGLSQKHTKPAIKSNFLDYERLTAFDKTGSYLAPMVTTIGLYDGLELVAVAKLGTPIKITPELPINFVVKMDF